MTASSEESDPRDGTPRRKRLGLGDRVEPVRTFLVVKAVAVGIEEWSPIATAFLEWFGPAALAKPVWKRKSDGWERPTCSLAEVIGTLGTGAEGPRTVVAASEGDGAIGPKADASFGVRALFAVQPRCVNVGRRPIHGVSIVATVHSPLIADRKRPRQPPVAELLQRLEAQSTWLHVVEWPVPGQDMRGGLSLLEEGRVQAGSIEEETRWHRYARVLDGLVPERMFRFGSTLYVPMRLVEAGGLTEQFVKWQEEWDRPEAMLGCRLTPLASGWLLNTHMHQYIPTDVPGRIARYDVTASVNVDAMYDRLRRAGILL